MTDSDTVAKVFSRKNGTGVDNITDIAGTDGIQNFFAAFAGLMADTGTDTVCLQKFACQRGGFDIKAHIVETADKRQRFLFILIGNADNDGSVVAKRKSRGYHRLVCGSV